VATAAALLHADFRQPQIDYATLLTLTRKITLAQTEVEQQFRRAIFNVLAGNRDDHAKNHAFVYDPERRAYRTSPAYDVTPSSGTGGEHNLAINGKGRDIGPADMAALAKTGGIRDTVARSIIDEVASAVSAWPAVAARFGIAKVRRDEISALIDVNMRPFGRAITRPLPRKSPSN